MRDTECATLTIKERWTLRYRRRLAFREGRPFATAVDSRFGEGGPFRRKHRLAGSDCPSAGRTHANSALPKGRPFVGTTLRCFARSDPTSDTANSSFRYGRPFKKTNFSRLCGGHPDDLRPARREIEGSTPEKREFFAKTKGRVFERRESGAEMKGGGLERRQAGAERKGAPRGKCQAGVGKKGAPLGKREAGARQSRAEHFGLRRAYPSPRRDAPKWLRSLILHSERALRSRADSSRRTGRD
jgi:hypothetical protein